MIKTSLVGFQGHQVKNMLEGAEGTTQAIYQRDLSNLDCKSQSPQARSDRASCRGFTFGRTWASLQTLFWIYSTFRGSPKLKMTL